MSDGSRPRRSGSGTSTNWRGILAVAGGVLLVWFIIVNSQQVQVTWWVIDTSTSLIVVILISALLGAGLTYFFTRVRQGPSRGEGQAARDRERGQR